MTRIVERTVWVARDKGLTGCYVYLWPENKKPERWKMTDGGVEFNLNEDVVEDIIEFDVKLFKKIFGFTPRQGTCTKKQMMAGFF